MADGDMKPITLWMGVEFAFMGLLTILRVVTLLGAAVMLAVWAWTADAEWIRGALIALLLYVIATAAFVSVARIPQVSTRDATPVDG